MEGRNKTQRETNEVTAPPQDPGEMKTRDYVATIRRAVEGKTDTDRVVEAAVQRRIANVFIVGCGGTQAIMYPGKYLLDAHSRIAGHAFNAGEFVNIKPRSLGDRSLVILSSYTGTTPETVAAARLASLRGSLVVSFVCTEGSRLGSESQFVFLNLAKKGSSEANLVRTYQILLGVMEQAEGFDGGARILRCMDNLPEGLASIKGRAEEEAVRFAHTYKHESLVYVIGGGICWGQALVYANCILEEMQWVSAQPIKAGEYFHGPFEIVDEHSRLLVLQGEDSSRPLLNRVIRFSQEHKHPTWVIDTKDYALPGVQDETRGYFSPFVLLAVLDRFSENLSRVRDHPLSTRRYMGKVDY